MDLAGDLASDLASNRRLPNIVSISVLLMRGASYSTLNPQPSTLENLLLRLQAGMLQGRVEGIAGRLPLYSPSIPVGSTLY